MSEKLRVLQLIDGLNIGGAEVLLRDLVRHLRDNGYPVSVGYSTPGPMLEQMQALCVPLVRLPRLARIDPWLLGEMVKLIRQVRPQIVHTHLFKSDLHGRLAARMCGVPVVVSTSHNNDVWARRQPLGWIYGLSNRLADRIVAVSEEVRAYQLEHTCTPPTKIITINNGVDVSRFAGQAEAGLRVRAELGIPVDAPVVGIIGRLSPQKDHATFLRAARLIQAELPQTRFVIVGDGPLRATLEVQSAELGLAEAVIFCGLRKDIPAILAVFDLLVFSSQWEGLPVTLLEGMAAGKAIVSTNVGGVGGVVLEGQSALLTAAEDPRALAEACCRLLHSPELRYQFGQVGLARVQKQYSLEAMLGTTINLYEELWQNHVETARS